MWGKWVEGNPNVKNLQWYLAHNVINDETSEIVPRALRNKLVPKLSLWPGTLFDKKKDPSEFQALIGKSGNLPESYLTDCFQGHRSEAPSPSCSRSTRKSSATRRSTR